MGCLTFVKVVPNSLYSWYFDNERWDDLITNFKLEMQNIYALSIDSQLEINL